jgi:tagatose 1,6-diphosphate aldolase
MCREQLVKIARGKLAGLRAVSNERGVIAALAIDQRNALRTLLAKARETTPEAIPDRMLEEFKEAVSRVLTPHASAILLDPEYGLPAARQRAKSAGLLLAYERTGYDKAIPGRLPRLLDHWSVQRLAGEGADCIKVLLYYSPFSAAGINDVKHAWVERVGAECAGVDVPFFLELVVYHDEMEEKSLEFARLKPETVVRSLEEFSKPQYGVDVFKVGVPVNMAYVGGGSKSEAAYTREEAKNHFQRAAAAAGRPFIYLSEGVSNETFNDALELAVEAHARFSGVLCGRATWKDGVEIYARRGLPALEDWLHEQGVKNIHRVNERLQAAAPWYAFYGVREAAELSS